MRKHFIPEQFVSFCVNSCHTNSSSLVQLLDDLHFNHLWALASLSFESLFQEEEIDLSALLHSKQNNHYVLDVLSLNAGLH